MPHDLKAVVFDLDGTLANTLPVAVEAFQATLLEFGRPALSQDEIFSYFGPTEDGVVKAMFGDASADAVPVFYRIHQRLLLRGVTPFPGLEDLLNASQARGLRLAVVTGKSERGATMTLEALGLMDVFELVRGGSDFGVVKAAAIMEILDLWGVSPAAAAYLGDHPRDVIEARSIGVHTLSAGWAPTVDLEAIREVHPEKLFLTVGEFAAWLGTEEMQEA